MQSSIIAILAAVSLSQAKPLEDVSGTHLVRGLPDIKRAAPPTEKLKMTGYWQQCDQNNYTPGHENYIGKMGVLNSAIAYKGLYDTYNAGINSGNITGSFVTPDRAMTEDEAIVFLFLERASVPDPSNVDDTKCGNNAPIDWTRYVGKAGKDDFVAKDGKPACFNMKANCAVLVPATATRASDFPTAPAIAQQDVFWPKLSPTST